MRRRGTGRARRRTVGFFWRLGRFLFAELDEYCVFADFNHTTNGQKNFLSGKSEPLATRDSEPEHVVFGERKGYIANLTEVFAVEKVYNVLLLNCQKRSFHNIKICARLFQIASRSNF